MTTEEQAQLAALSQIHFNLQVVQAGQEIRIMVQIGTDVGVMNQYFFNQDVARMLSKALKNAVEQAEVTVIKPPSMVHEA